MSLPWCWDAFITWPLPSFPTSFLPTSYHITWISAILTALEIQFEQAALFLSSMSLSELFLLPWKFIPHTVDTVVALLSSVLFLSIATPTLFTYPISLVLWFELSALANHHDFTLWFQFLVQMTQAETVRHEVRFMWKIFPDSSQGILEFFSCNWCVVSKPSYEHEGKWVFNWSLTFGKAEERKDYVRSFLNDITKLLKQTNIEANFTSRLSSYMNLFYWQIFLLVATESS